MRTYSYKAKCSKQTHQNLDEFLAQQRILYNAALQERIDCYRKTGKSISFYDQCKSLTLIRADDADYRKFHAGSQRSVLNRLHKGYGRFFRCGGFPRFKGRNRSIKSFDTVLIKPEFRGKYGYLKVKGIGEFKWKTDNRAENIKYARIVKKPNGVYVQLICETETHIEAPNKLVGIDVGVKARATLSNGVQIEKRKPDRSEIKRLQRRVARAKRGSNNRDKKKAALSKATYRLDICNKNELHRLTTNITSKHGRYIAVEALNVKAMTANGGAYKKGLNRSILEQNWGFFKQILSYKAESAGGKLIEVDPQNTTQKCSSCGGMPNEKLTLSARWYHCGHCGYSEDRDVNAAKNIAQRGRDVLLSGGDTPETWVLENQKLDSSLVPRRTVELAHV